MFEQYHSGLDDIVANESRDAPDARRYTGLGDIYDTYQCAEPGDTHFNNLACYARSGLTADAARMF